MVVTLYVDDLIFTRSNTKLIEEFKEVMKKEFEMTDLGLMKYFLGLEVKQSEEGIFISQERYAFEILKKLKMEDCNPVSTPMKPGTKLSKFDGEKRADTGRYRSLVRSLRYLTSTRPDLMLSVGITRRFMEDPSYTHWKALKRIPRYVRGTLSLDERTVIRVDNKSAIELAKNLVNHGRSKHIDVRFHFIREQVKEGKVELEHVESRAQDADIFTKSLPTTLLESCKRLIGMRDGKNI
ncbi:uncharacterized mitochondrial protein AtMg00810-like [Impatiens glandulifera]|uniref:uncharacterized mitochondrial protein AtMg00810-like n=1 Tax=Impatiens glandulifera TaxID=253017 RepID=UPI001FB16183|nr:uncharacterized mitochondrial protein AtMg00810-like [Impatiens glandulifera]